MDYLSNHPEPCKQGIVYSQALRIIERCSETKDVEDNLENLKKTSRFVADKGFEGTERGAGSSSRSGPVQFERNEEEDPFGLDQFLATAKSASNKRSNDDSADKRRGDDRDRSDRKRRRD